MIVPIKGIGTAGIVSDIRPVELPENVISDGNNIRIFSSGVYSAYGYEKLTENPVQFNPAYLIHNHSSDDVGEPAWVLGGDDSIWSFDSVWTDITPDGSTDVFNPYGWSGCNLGKICIINNVQPLYYDAILKGDMIPLPFSPDVTWPEANKSFKVIRNYNNFLFALNLTEDGEHYPDGYRWSHPADSNGIPFTWDESDISSIASRESLGGDDGAIVDGLTLRNSFVIYSERGIDVLDYTGDDYLFARRSLATSAGILATNCVVESKGLHYYISDGDVLVNDGTSVTSIMQDKVRAQFVSDISTDFYKNSYAVKNDLHKELWFCIPTSGSEYPNVAYVYNYHTKAWGRREIPDNTPYAAQGGISLPKVTWGSAVGSWGEQVRTWASRKLSPENETVVGCGIIDSSMNVLDTTTANDDVRTSYIERISLPLAGAVKNVSINAIYPHMSGSATVQIRVGGQDFVGGPISWDDPVDFTPNIDRKVDVRATGALLCYRISYTGRETWRITGMELDIVERGDR
ncbi:MAG: hypothetical protein DRQ58_09275 [Gammaproteobacteria bacterium]|nr:MAG: hypothetical protein DRQ58_09275 [Gammaproteobacteria bacterium]